MTSMSFDHNLKFAHFPFGKTHIFAHPTILTHAPPSVRSEPLGRTSVPPRPYISAPLAVHLRPSDRTPAVFSFKGGLIFAIPAWVFPLFRPARPFPTRPARSRPARPFPTPTRPFPLPTRPFTHSAFEPPPAGRVTGAEAETGRRGRRSLGEVAKKMCEKDRTRVSGDVRSGGQNLSSASEFVYRKGRCVESNFNFESRCEIFHSGRKRGYLAHCTRN